MTDTFFNPRLSLSVIEWAILLTATMAAICSFVMFLTKKSDLVRWIAFAVVCFLCVLSFVALIPLLGNTAAPLHIGSVWFSGLNGNCEIHFGIMSGLVWSMIILLACITIMSSSSLEILDGWHGVSVLMMFSMLALAWGSSNVLTLLMALGGMVFFQVTYALLVVQPTQAFTLIKSNISIQCLGILLVLLGAVISSTQGNAMLFYINETNSSVLQSAAVLTWLGVVLLLIAPIVLSVSEVLPSQQEMLFPAIILPTLAAFAGVWRLSAFWKDMHGASVLLGFVLLLSLMIVLIRFWQSTKWKTIWLSTSVVMGAYLGIFSPSSGLMVMISAVFGFLTYLLMEDVSKKNEFHWVLYLPAWLCCGGPLGLLNSALTRFATQAEQSTGNWITYGMAEAIGLVMVLFFIPKLHGQIEKRKSKPVHPNSTRSYFLLVSIPLLFSFPWTANVLGGASSTFDLSPLFSSWFASVGTMSLLQSEKAIMNEATWIPFFRLASFLLAVVLSSWISLRGQHHVERISRYYLEQEKRVLFFAKKYNRTEAKSRNCVRFVETYLWRVFLPKKIFHMARMTAAFSLKWTGEFQNRGYYFLEQLIIVPGKALQLVQNGDVQWYISITLISVILLFFKFSKATI